MDSELTPDPFSATVQSLNGQALVALAGELDIRTAPELERVLTDLIAAGPAQVAVDFSDVSFVDSSGLAVLVAAQNALQVQGRSLRIRAARPGAYRVFEITSLVEYLHVEGGQDGVLPPRPAGPEG